MTALQNNRDRQICNASDLPSPRRFWTVIVQVLRKDGIKIAKSEKKITKAMCSLICRLMWPYNRYYLSNDLIEDANPEYQIATYGYGWTFSGLTHVELIEDSVPYTIPCNFNFTKFSELCRWTEHDEPIGGEDKRYRGFWSRVKQVLKSLRF